MTTPNDHPATVARLTADVRRLHHVGHLVRDIAAALTLYRRMGFRLAPPAFPALPPAPGQPPQAFGAGNTHAEFRRNFVEIVTVVGADGTDTSVDGATLVPLEAPEAAPAHPRENISRTSARVAADLARFEGLHILVFETPDADRAAARLAGVGVTRSGVNRLRRPSDAGDGDGDGAHDVPVGYVEIGYAEIDGEPGRSPEGRVALAEPLPADARKLVPDQAAA